MSKLDKYILVQLFGPFLFFCLVFAGILWLNQALAIIDIVIENGQPASIFIELSVLLLPRVLESSVPIAGFAASVFITNRLYGESELVVMMAAGLSNIQLTKPYFLFGFICMIVMFFLIQFVSPWAKTLQLDKREEIKRQFITQIIQPGEFITSQEGFTFFFGEKNVNGSVKDVLIEERVTPIVTITHIAQSGQVVSNDDGVTLLLSEGSIQRLNTQDKNISLIQFDTLAFDLSHLGSQLPIRKVANSELNFNDLRAKINETDPLSKSLFSLNVLFHERIVVTLLVLLSPVLGMAALLVGGFSRSGFLLRISVGILLMAAINSFRGAAETWASQTVTSWPYIYAPVLLTIGLIIGLVWLSNLNLASIFAKLPALRGAKT